ncbi:hypothetical protein GCM10023063_39770 [Arthrobacter methylotrophus]
MMIGPKATPLAAPMLERITTTAMHANMMPKYGDPIDAKRGVGLLRVWDSGAVVIACPFVVVRAGGRSGHGAPLY